MAISQNEVELKWTPPDANGATIEKYEVEWYQADASGTAEVQEITLTSDHLDGFATDTAGYWKASLGSSQTTGYRLMQVRVR